MNNAALWRTALLCLLLACSIKAGDVTGTKVTISGILSGNGRTDRHSYEETQLYSWPSTPVVAAFAHVRPLEEKSLIACEQVLKASSETERRLREFSLLMAAQGELLAKITNQGLSVGKDLDALVRAFGEHQWVVKKALEDLRTGFPVEFRKKDRVRRLRWFLDPSVFGPSVDPFQMERPFRFAARLQVLGEGWHGSLLDSVGEPRTRDAGVVTGGERIETLVLQGINSGFLAAGAKLREAWDWSGKDIVEMEAEMSPVEDCIPEFQLPVALMLKGQFPNDRAEFAGAGLSLFTYNRAARVECPRNDESGRALIRAIYEGRSEYERKKPWLGVSEYEECFEGEKGKRGAK